jgi:hypothetical protein
MDFAETEYLRNLPGLENVKEHPLMANIRNAIIRYREQSPARFDVAINLKQAFRVEETELTHSSKLQVLFIGFQHIESYVCRPVFRRHPRKKVHVLTKEVEILDKGRNRFIPLNDFLNEAYPGFPDLVGNEQMQAWWAATGKGFNWTSLPTELKEQVIGHCIDQSPRLWDARLSSKRYDNRDRLGRQIGIHEIAEKLSDWATLLAVSHQVRAITMRSCFIGTRVTGTYGAFVLSSSTGCRLESAFRRFGRYYQMIEPNSLPTNSETQALAECYKQHPKIYPHLKQYATFRHGLRKIRLTFGFIGYMHFFKVIIGGFDRYLRPGSLSYEVFEQLPNLSEISLRLPLQPRQGWNNLPYQPGPVLFHNDAPCPRKLHRVIYERIAEVLTLHLRVRVTNFMDKNEMVRYDALRYAALKNCKWSAADYEELYAECDGGVQLDELVQPGSWVHLIEEGRQGDSRSVRTATKVEIGTATEDTIDTPFFPPKCDCKVKCHLVFEGKERKVRWSER